MSIYDGTLIGSPTFTSTGVVSGFGQALVLNGSSQYISIPSIPYYSFNPPSGGAWTVSCWVKSSDSVHTQCAISCWDSSIVGWQFAYSSGSGMGVQFGGSGIGGTYTSSVTDGSWHHLEVDYDGTKAYFFIDGTLKGFATTISWTQAGNDTALQIGATVFGTGGSPTQFWNGQIDEVSAFSYCLHTANFTPPTAPYANNTPGLQAVYHLDGDATYDITGTPIFNYNGTIGGSPIFTSSGVPSGFNGAIVLNGTTDYVYIPNIPISVNAPSFPASTPWTQRCRVKSSSPQNGPCALSCFDASINGWQIIMSGSGGTGFAQIGGTAMGSGTHAAIADGNWHDIELGWDAGSQNGYFFIDGVLQNSGGTHVIPAHGTNPSFQIGMQQLGTQGTPNHFWPGQIAEVASFDTCLHTANFTPPTAAYVGNEANLIALWHLDTNANSGVYTNTILDTLGTYNGNIVGYPQPFDSSSVAPSFNNAMTFVGDGNVIFDRYISITNVPPSMNATSGSSWTQACWIKTTDFPAVEVFPVQSIGLAPWRISVPSTSTNYFNDPSHAFGVIANTVINTTSIPTIRDGNWHHLELGYDGAKGYFFIDGLLQNVGGTTAAWTPSTTQPEVRLGAGWRDSLDEVATFNICLHTANFTPPTTPYSNGATGLVAAWHLDTITNTSPIPTAALLIGSIATSSTVSGIIFVVVTISLSINRLANTFSGLGTLVLAPSAIFTSSTASGIPLAVQVLTVITSSTASKVIFCTVAIPEAAIQRAATLLSSPVSIQLI